MGIFDGVLLCSDIDGTLTDNGRVPEQNREFIRYFMENGGLFTVSTGRLPHYLKEAGLSVVPNVPMICTNGTVIYDLSAGRVLYEAKLSESLVEEVRDYAAAGWQEAECFVYDTERMLRATDAETGFSVNKLMFRTPNEDIAIHLEQELGKRFANRIQVARSWEVGVEVIPIDSGKGVCVKKLKSLCGAKLLICVGDYENDITMLKAADIGYAVENALDVVKAAADRITVSNTEGAIAEIIKKTELELRNQLFKE